MTTPTMTLDCDGFASVLADYLEGDATPAVRAAVEAHAASCAACSQLLDDLNGIRTVAAALPPLEPSRDLWTEIAPRLETRVLPLDVKRTMAPLRRRWYMPAVAAAALVVVTAGVTHYLTRASLAGPAAPSSVVAVAKPPVPAEPNAQIVSTQVERPVRSVSTPVPAKVTPVRLARAEAEAGEPVLESEVAALRKIMRARRAQLDPRTIAVLEQSIAIIDSAIVQSRAALARDPASAFLATQLNRSLEKKVDLLRTAAQLPAGT